MKKDNIKTEYQIILNDPLRSDEIKRLKEVEHIFDLSSVEYDKCMIRLVSGYKDQREVFSTIARWLAYIGGEMSIFCIQEVNSYYTGFVSEKIAKLMKV